MRVLSCAFFKNNKLVYVTVISTGNVPQLMRIRNALDRISKMSQPFMIYSVEDSDCSSNTTWQL